jgi:hypothetical protein
MNHPPEAEVSLKLFELIEREQSEKSPFNLFPTKIGVLLAAADLLRAAGHFPGSKPPKGWRKAVEGFVRRTKDRKYTLKVLEIGGYWFVVRRTSRLFMDYEHLALAFEEIPLCTRTDQEAMRLADYCHPDPGITFRGCWAPSFSKVQR